MNCSPPYLGVLQVPEGVTHRPPGVVVEDLHPAGAEVLVGADQPHLIGCEKEGRYKI